MSRRLRQWTRRYSIWAMLYGLSVVLFSACSTPNTVGASVTQPIPSSSVKVAPPLRVTGTQTASVPTTITTSQPTLVPSPTQSTPPTSCTGYKYDNVCIIDPQRLLTGQPAAPDAITPMIKDMAMTVTTGTVTVSQRYGVLYLTLSDENGSGDDRDYCKQLIFLTFSVTESDYLFPATSITCHAGIITLIATLNMKTAKKIDWNTLLTVAEEAAIAWNQYDTRYETT